MTTSWTQADIDDLEAEIKRHRLRVRFGDREMQDDTLAEKMKLLQTMKDAVAVAAGTGASRTTYARFRKGSQSGGSGDD